MSVSHRRVAGRIVRNLLAVIAVTAIFGFKAAAPVAAAADATEIAAR